MRVSQEILGYVLLKEKPSRSSDIMGRNFKTFK